MVNATLTCFSFLMVIDRLSMSVFSVSFCKKFHNMPIILHSSRNPLIRKPVRVINSSDNKKVVRSTGLTVKEDHNPSIRNEFLVNKQKQVSLAPRNVIQHPIIRYEKLEEADRHFTRILTMVKSQKDREASGKLLLEGVRLINDAIDAGAKLEMILFSRKEELSRLRIKNDDQVKIYRVLYKTLQMWSSLTTCPGIMGVFKRPTMSELNVKTDPALPVTVICDNITDPGKMGALIRSAAAVGCKAVLLMKGCIDVWMHKVLRSGCGAQFRVPIISDIEWTHVLNYIPSNASFFVLNSKNKPEIIINENANEYIEFTNDEEESEKRYRTQTENDNIVIVDESYEDWHDLQKYNSGMLRNSMYMNIFFPKDNIVLFVSDETVPLNLKAVKLSCELGGTQLNFPFENNVKSISPCFTLPIVLYEIRRQMIEKYVTE